MKIKEVKTAVKVGDFVLKQNHRNKIDIKYLSNISKSVLNDNIARIYLFVQDKFVVQYHRQDKWKQVCPAFPLFRKVWF